MHDSFLQDAVRRQKIGAIHLLPEQVGKACDKSTDVAAGSLRLDRHRNGIAVVFDEKKYRELLQTRDVQGFPELTFACGSISPGHQSDLIRAGIEQAARLSTSHCLHELRAG